MGANTKDFTKLRHELLLPISRYLLQQHLLVPPELEGMSAFPSLSPCSQVFYNDHKKRLKAQTWQTRISTGHFVKRKGHLDTSRFW